MFEKIFNSFIPLFFAIDVIGILPMYIAMTRNIVVIKRSRIVRQAAFTAFLIGVGFVFLGKEVFHMLGITVPDFKIGGGILLLIIAILDLLFSDKAERGTNEKIETMGIVPIGMPLIIGPAVLTTLLLSVGTNGYNATLIAFILNILIVWLVFKYSAKVIRFIGESGAIAIGKVFSLLLTAIAVMMIRVGITEMIAMVKSGP
jgi:multiple antibiotic resistance protein